MNYEIKSNIIQKILDLTDIVEIVNSKIFLKKKGDYFFALCPFHKEKTPSFSINKNKKFYYCFGCKSYGNVINFLMNFENLTFIQTIEKLSEINNININDIKTNFLDKKLNIYFNIMKFICNLYHNNLLNIYNKNNLLKNYLKDKNWNINLIKKFNIGYSSYNLLINNIKNFDNIKLLVKLGILYKKNNKYIDKFCNRIIFPIYNSSGNIVALGGRIINNLLNPKYINSSENIIFKKRCNLFGLFQVKNIYYNNIPQILLVEGYTDVISLFKFNINYSVSIMGSFLTSENISIIFNYTNKLIFCYDGDNIGYLSTIKSFKKILPYITDDRQIKFIILPKNEDPDSLIKKIGKIKFEELINNSLDISEFLFNHVLKYNLSIFFNKIDFIKKSINLINIIPGKLIKFFLKKKLCIKLNIEFNELNNLLINNNNNYKIFFINKKNEYNPICIGINLLVKNPSLYKLIKIPFEIEIINNFDMKIFLKLVYLCYRYNIKNTKDLLFFFKNKNILNYLLNLLKLNTMIVDNEKNDIFIDILNKIYILLLQNNQENLILKEKKYGLNIVEKNKLLLLNNKLFNLYKYISIKK